MDSTKPRPTVYVADNRDQMGRWVARHAAQRINNAIDRRGVARIVVATGSSQFEVLDHLCGRDDIEWSKVTGFHLDEYIGISPDHPASFARYLRERFVDRVPISKFHFLHGNRDVDETMISVGGLLSDSPIDVGLVGIGENGHLAFNDPPADFETTQPYLSVPLDEACRRQQVGEGWFEDLQAVPERAISMSIRQIMAIQTLFCSVPDARKATAVRASIMDEVSNLVPASILQNHPDTHIVLDKAAAAELDPDRVDIVRIDE